MWRHRDHPAKPSASQLEPLNRSVDAYLWAQYWSGEGPKAGRAVHPTGLGGPSSLHGGDDTVHLKDVPIQGRRLTHIDDVV